MQAVIQILKEHQADQFTTLTQKHIILLQKRPGTEEIKLKDSTYVEGAVDNNSVTQEKFTVVSSKIEEKELPVQLQYRMADGASFGDYGQIDNVLTQGKTHLKHQQGQVLLVDVWATWCGPCQGPMQHNQEMLQKNEAAWQKKVKIIAVSVDDDKQKLSNRINTRGWTRIQHLTLNGWNGDHKLVKDFSISGIPFVCLVDKFGKIRFQGHPSSINLQQKINELIAQQSEGNNQESAGPNVEQNIDISKWITVQSIKAQFPKTQLLCFKAQIQRTFNKGVISNKSTIDAYVWEGDHQTINNLKTTLKDVSVKINEIKYVQVPQLPQVSCWECKTVLNYPYYWLKWEEGTHFACKSCIEDKKQINQPHNFFYNKNSVYLTGPWQKIAVKGLGKNLQPEDISKAGNHGFGCNSCQKTSVHGEARYISLGCRSDPNFRRDYVDLCQKCFKELETEKVINALLPDGHLKNHPFLRILYNTKGYFEY